MPKVLKFEKLLFLNEVRHAYFIYASHE